MNFMAAELAYHEISMQGPNKFLEEQARELYPIKLRWVSENIKHFAEVHRKWKGHSGGYTFTQEESGRREGEGGGSARGEGDPNPDSAVERVECCKPGTGQLDIFKIHSFISRQRFAISLAGKICGEGLAVTANRSSLARRSLSTQSHSYVNDCAATHLYPRAG